MKTNLFLIVLALSFAGCASGEPLPVDHPPVFALVMQNTNGIPDVAIGYYLSPAAPDFTLGVNSTNLTRLGTAAGAAVNSFPIPTNVPLGSLLTGVATNYDGRVSIYSAPIVFTNQPPPRPATPNAVVE